MFADDPYLALLAIAMGPTVQGCLDHCKAKHYFLFLVASDQIVHHAGAKERAGIGIEFMTNEDDLPRDTELHERFADPRISTRDAVDSSGRAMFGNELLYFA